MKSWYSCLGPLVVLGCGAVFPEVTPPLKAPPPGRELAPPPPRDLLFVDFPSAEIPARTRDGRRWDSVGGELPDPFVKFFVDDRELIKTPIQSDTLKPTWPDQKRANYRIPEGAKIRVELWDSNPINNHPICVKRLFDLHGQAGPAPIEIDCESGAELRVRVEPAHAQWGLGFSYELRTGGAAVTAVLAHSPAARSGLRAGDELVEIQGKKVAQMEEGEVQSKINANAQGGIEFLLKGADKTERKVVLKEGVVYPSADEGAGME